MGRAFRYLSLFAALLAVQVFMLDGMDFGPYVQPVIYVAFILLLPMEVHPALLLLSGAAAGAAADLGAATAGLNVIASALTAFIRPYLLVLTVGRSDVRDGGAPLPGRIGAGRFLKYAALAVFVHCVVLRAFETLVLREFPATLLQGLCGGALSLALVYVAAVVFDDRRAAQ